MIFCRESPDGEEGYPGNLKVQVTISLENSSIILKYHAESDQDTIVNFTNHSYFNLNGQGTIHEHLLQIRAEQFTVNDMRCLPTGELMAVAGTAMDFRYPCLIGDGIDKDEACVKLYGGYDANYILTGVNPAAVVSSAKSGISMTMITDQPGVQLYTANNMPERKGKNGVRYGHRSALCLETQHYPDCIHHSEWPSCLLRAGENFDSTTVYAFSTNK